MIKVDYNFTTTTPVHTGADTNMGTLKSLRRQKVILKKAKTEKTKYNTEMRREALRDILFAVYSKIDKDQIKGKRLMKIWDEFHSKVLQAATASNKIQFLNRLSQLWDIKSIDDTLILQHLDYMSDSELLQTVRDESIYLVLSVRKLRDDKKNKVKKTKNNLFSNIEEKKEVEIKKYYDLVPAISGNSIRGILRRISMKDFVDRVGITKLPKDLYHILFTGGVLDSSTQFENLDRRESFIKNNPLVAVFGSAIGNMTIEGLLSVGWAYPKCLEMGTSDKSYWTYLDTVFQTRRDDSEIQHFLELEQGHPGTSQMKYEYEVFATGTPFTHAFRFMELDDITTSAFWRVLELFKENSSIGGMKAIGNSYIDLSEIKIPKNASKLYLDYLEKNKKTIKDFFGNL